MVRAFHDGRRLCDIINEQVFRPETIYAALELSDTSDQAYRPTSVVSGHMPHCLTGYDRYRWTRSMS